MIQSFTAKKHETTLNLDAVMKTYTLLVVVLVSLGCHNKVPPTGWLKSIEMYHLTIPDASHLK